jgi:5'-deoxynucleotidase YfbR-like HD superfamily hydrolase
VIRLKIHEEIISLVKTGETLKRISRTGWSLAGVQCLRPESVGEHSYGAVLVSLLVSKVLVNRGESVNQNRVALMATLHDLPESLTSDIPRVAAEVGGVELNKAKNESERKVIDSISEKNAFFGTLITNLWNDFSEAKSIEARIVQGSDIIDMLVHALSLETSGVTPSILDQFFYNSYESVRSLGLDVIEDVFWELYEEHIENANRLGVSIRFIERS